eukprot:TRINITY_DN37586_c0_g1_i1.p1 TRINITY_DN37586_c0_g1~~TRINITY_DN37586_c0_g1_i1.p1  ORF type:complete len:332 (-),score=40.34 TRINITY_DN37586_c0_g1_i1:410-1405(-)
MFQGLAHLLGAANEAKEHVAQHRQDGEHRLDGEHQEGGVVPVVDEEMMLHLVHQYAVLLEYERLKDVLPSGLYVMPSFESVLTWHGTVFVHRGYYAGGVFKFSIVMCDDYPEVAPEVRFTCEVFHPLVCPESGLFQIRACVPEWTPGRDYTSLLMPHIHRTFHRHDYLTRSPQPLNPTAFSLLKINPEAFARRASACAEKSRSDVYKNPAGTSLPFAKNPVWAQDRIIEQLRASDPSHPLEERTGAFADWFCEHYSQERVFVDTQDSNVETREIPGNVHSRASKEDNSLPEWAPAEGWISHGADTDDDEDEEAVPGGEAAEDQDEEQTVQQ